MAEKKGSKLTASEKEAILNRTAESEKNAEKMGRKVVSAKAEKKNTTGLRVGAFVLWAIGLALEIAAVLVLNGTIPVGANIKLYVLIGALVLDMIAVIIGSQLWKKANHLNPASEKNKLTFWLWNNMGVIAAVICFAPIIVLFLTNKDLDKKSKAIVTVVAVVALLIAGVSSYDFNPVSQEDMEAAAAAAEQYNAGVVYYTEHGGKFHYFADCQHIQTSIENDNVYKGTVQDAWESGYTELCKTCAKKAGQPTETETATPDGE